MMQMFHVRLHDAALHAGTFAVVHPRAHRPPPDGQQRIINRHTQYHDGNRQGNQERIFVEGLQRDHSQRETDEHASRIAEKNRRRMKVVAQKSQASANETEQQQDFAGSLLHDQNAGQADGRNDRQSRRQSVQPVNQIERIDDGHQPDHHQRAIHRCGQIVAQQLTEMRS